MNDPSAEYYGACATSPRLRETLIDITRSQSKLDASIVHHQTVAKLTRALLDLRGTDLMVTPADSTYFHIERAKTELEAALGLLGVEL